MTNLQKSVTAFLLGVVGTFALAFSLALIYPPSEEVVVKGTLEEKIKECEEADGSFRIEQWRCGEIGDHCAVCDIPSQELFKIRIE